jgi:UPF0755 protein
MTDTPTDAPDEPRVPPPEEAGVDDLAPADPDAPVRWEEPLSRREARTLGGPRRRRWPAVLASFALIALLGVGAAGFWAFRQIDPPGDPGDDVALEIPENTGTTAIADLLAENGIITNSTVFQAYVKYKGVGGDWLAGAYVFKEDMSFDEAIEVLAAGPGEIAFEQVTIPEGFTVFANAGLPAPGTLVQRIADPDNGVPRFTTQRLMEILLSGNLRSQFLPPEVANLEGFLFPDTYRIEEEENANALLTRMVRRFDEVATQAGIGNATELVSQATGGQVQITPYQAVIVASLIERETLIADERPMVARVIYNRLQNGVALGIDASLNYALGRPATTESDLATDTPFNLREVAGLPPTPIAVPGQASLAAAVAPADGQWMYYVLTDQEGHHTFTNTYDEFLQAKEQCQAIGLC